LYSILLVFLKTLFAVVFRWEVKGIENIPSHGGVIIASNHISLWDPPVLGSATPRPVHFMAKEELFTIPVFSWIIRKLHSFPVRRGSADRTAIRTMINLLECGEIVGIFPEGTRSKTGQLGQPELGVAMVALKTGMTIVPAAIIGTNKIWGSDTWFPRIKVMFGKPILVKQGKTDKDAIESLSRTIMNEIADLLSKGK
jgi:1-acyl-sn-glycerol-3-phosphate acyltransferase